MSQHPLGPWSVDASTVYQCSPQSSMIVPHILGISPLIFPGNTIPQKDFRSGFNSGRLRVYDIPRSASRILGSSKVSPAVGTSAMDYHGTYVESRAIVGWGFFDSSLESYSSYLSLSNAGPCRDKALLKALAKRGPVMDSLVSLGEGRETLGLLKRSLDIFTGRHNKYVSDLATSLKRGTRLRGRRFSRNSSMLAAASIVSDARLQYSFGIRPLISDADSFLNALAQLSVGVKTADTFSSVSSKSETLSIALSDATVGSLSGSRQLTVEMRSIGKVGYSVVQDNDSGAQTRSAADLFGWTTARIAPTAWELLPYSCFVDYFTNVGDLITVASANRTGCTNGWEIYINEVKLMVRFSPTYGAFGPLITRQDGTFEHKYFTFTRDPLDISTALPSMRLEIPSVAQTANLLSWATLKMLVPVFGKIL